MIIIIIHTFLYRRKVVTSEALAIDLYLLPLDEQLYESSVRLLKLSDNREMH